MKRYSVLLLVPDYASIEFGHETFYAWVSALTPKDAGAQAQAEAVKVFTVEGREELPQDDFYILGVWAGHQEMLVVDE
jgi:hypothetical protein